MAKLLIIGPKKTGTSTKMLMKEAEKVFKTKYVPVNEIVLELGEKPRILHGGKSISNYDYCLPRIDSKRAQHGYHVIRFMDSIGMKKPYSSQAVLISHNKFMSLDVLKKAGVPIPKTYLISSIETAKQVLKKMKYPIVVKIVGGFGGVGVMMFDSKEAALSAIQTLRLLKQEIIIEEFIPNAGEDIRAFVVNDEVVASMKRVAKKGETRANIFQGGHGKYIALSSDMEDIALKAANAVSSDIIAIDMIESPDGPKVIEVNLNPGIKGIEKVVNKNIAKIIIDFVASQVK